MADDDRNLKRASLIAGIFAAAVGSALGIRSLVVQPADQPPATTQEISVNVPNISLSGEWSINEDGTLTLVREAPGAELAQRSYEERGFEPTATDDGTIIQFVG